MNLQRAIHSAADDIMLSTDHIIGDRHMAEAILTFLQYYKNGRQAPEVERAIKVFLYQDGRREPVHNAPETD